MEKTEGENGVGETMDGGGEKMEEKRQRRKMEGEDNGKEIWGVVGEREWRIRGRRGRMEWGR